MARKLLLLTAALILLQGYNRLVAQSSDDLLNLMINKGVITQNEADSIRAEAAIKAQSDKEKQKKFTFNTSRLLQFSGYVQFRYQNFQAEGIPDGFDIRRARLDIRGDILPTWEYRLQVDFAVVPKVLDAYAGFKPYSFLKIQGGQFKLPISAENLMASHKMEFIDRAQVVEAMTSRSRDILGSNNGRDVGVMAYGSLLKHNERFLAEYSMGIFNGQGANITDKNEAKDFCGRLLLHPIAGLDIGGSYYNGYDYMIVKPDTGNFIRIRYAGEAAWSFKRIILRGEYISGDDGPVKKEGFNIQAIWSVIPKKLQLLARYDQFEPNKHKGQDISVWYVSGINFYFNDYAKVGLNYSYRTEEGGKDMMVSNDLMSVQVQIGF